ncbi:MAG: division/cell wall cluster transcriptional repressor MraZ [Acidimicrobiales bacterium]
MGRFYGQHEHALDVKGRVFLPAKFRPSFAEGGFLTRYNGGCLALWTPEKFEILTGDLEETQDQSSALRNRARLFSSGTEEVEVDRQGRLAIAPHLRSFAQLTNEVLVIGVLNRVELWNPAVWAETSGPPTHKLVIDED